MVKRSNKSLLKKLKELKENEKGLARRNPLRIISDTRKKYNKINDNFNEYKNSFLESSHNSQEYKNALNEGNKRMYAVAVSGKKITPNMREQMFREKNELDLNIKKQLEQEEKERKKNVALEVSRAISKEGERTIQEATLRSARALRSEVESFGKKRLSAKRMEAIIKPKFSKIERRLKYRPMASNILLANSY